MVSNKRFGELLSEGIVSVSRRQSKTIVAVEWEIAQVFGFVLHHIVETLAVWLSPQRPGTDRLPGRLPRYAWTCPQKLGKQPAHPDPLS